MAPPIAATSTRGAFVHVHSATGIGSDACSLSPLSSSSSSPTPSSSSPSPSSSSSAPTLASASPPATHWRPFPWNYIPDWAAAVLGFAFILPVAPFMGILIGTSELVWALCLWAHKHLRLGVINAAVRKLAERAAPLLLKDPRNAPYLPYIFFLALWAPGLFLWALYKHHTEGFQWSVFFLYHFLRIGPRFRFFAHQHVLLHKEGHDRNDMFKVGGPLLSHICQWFIGPFYGQVPYSYYVAHNKIHHRYDNGLDDVHTNLDLDRTRPLSLVIYTPRFFLYWAGLSPLAFFLHKREYRLAREMAAGMLYYYALIALALSYDWAFGLAFAVFPLMESVIFFSAISYLWHAFVDPADPDNQYVNSITILNGRDNIWNEDYHVVHHTAPRVHWTDYPKHYQEHIEEYKRSRASIFRDTEEGEMLVWMIGKRFDLLAKHFVDLENKMSEQEKLDLLLTRLRATLSKASIEAAAEAKRVKDEAWKARRGAIKSE